MNSTSPTDLSKMIKIFENEGYIDYWTETAKRKVPNKVSNKIKNVNENVKNSKILKSNKNKKEKFGALKNEFYHSKYFNDLCEDIKKEVEMEIKKQIDEYCNNYINGIENEKLKMSPLLNDTTIGFEGFEFSSVLGSGFEFGSKNDKKNKIELFSNETIKQIERRFLKLEDEEFKKQSKISLYFILKNKPNSIPLQLLIEKQLLKKNEKLYFKDEIKSKIKLNQDGKLIYNESKRFRNLKSLLKKMYHTNESFWNVIKIKRDDKFISLNEIRNQLYLNYDLKIPSNEKLQQDDDDDEEIIYKPRDIENIILKKKINQY
eukprot:gene3466-6115_t